MVPLVRPSLSSRCRQIYAVLIADKNKHGATRFDVTEMLICKSAFWP